MSKTSQPAEPAVRPETVSANAKPWRAGLLAGVMTLATALVSGSILYQLSLDALRSELRENLIRSAKTAAVVIDAESHRQFNAPAQESSAAYQKAIQPLEQIRLAAGDIKFIYTCVLISNRVHFILDPTPAGDADRDGTDDKSHIMQAYDDPSPELVKVLRDGKAGADAQPYTDEWGTFISGYAPFVDSTGKIAGVVGVDLDAASYVQRLSSMRTAAWTGTGVALALSLIAGIGFYRLQSRIEQFRRKIEQLNTELEAKVAERTAQLDTSNKQLAEEVIERRRSEAEAKQARRAAETANRTKSEFLATMTHELRTPMNGVVGMANVLLATPLDDDQAECAQIIRSSGESLLGIVDNILDFSMLEGEELGMEVVPYDPREVVQNVVDVLSTRAQDKNLVMQMKVASDLPGQLVSDAGRVRQVLMNLVDNAIKFTENGSVTVEVRVTDHACDVELGENCLPISRSNTSASACPIRASAFRRTRRCHCFRNFPKGTPLRRATRRHRTRARAVQAAGESDGRRDWMLQRARQGFDFLVHSPGRRVRRPASPAQPEATADGSEVSRRVIEPAYCNFFFASSGNETVAAPTSLISTVAVRLTSTSVLSSPVVIFPFTTNSYFASRTILQPELHRALGSRRRRCATTEQREHLLRPRGIQRTGIAAVRILLHRRRLAHQHSRLIRRALDQAQTLDGSVVLADLRRRKPFARVVDDHLLAFDSDLDGDVAHFTTHQRVAILVRLSVQRHLSAARGFAPDHLRRVRPTVAGLLFELLDGRGDFSFLIRCCRHRGKKRCDERKRSER
jgi:signal transduction histidine kinase